MAKCEVDFLGIGAQRSGTSWLWENLRQHPGIWMPPRKELHYFDRSPKYPSSNLLASTHLIHRLFGSGEHNRRFRDSFRRDVLVAVRGRNLGQINWVLRYYLGTYNDDWYISLFKDAGDKVKGEITPAYSILEREDVRHIRSLFSELKVILILRNPLERAWSEVRFGWTRGRLKDLDHVDLMRGFIDSPGQSLRSDYLRMVDIWLSCFPRERMFIGFYDDIAQNPGGLISKILEFLEVRPIEIEKFPSLNRKVNIAWEKEIPAEVRYYLAKKYRDPIEQLSHFVGGHAFAWLREADEVLESMGRLEP